MNLTELSVKRPTAIVVLFLFLAGLGAMGYLNLGADLFPSVNTPVISVHSVYIGAGAEEIEKDVVKPIEDAVSGISGIDKMRSVSGEGLGYTLLQFTMDTDMNSALLDVQKAIDGIADKLPGDAERPVVRKFDVNSLPILIISVSGTAPYEELRSRAEELTRSLENLQGVGNVSLQGAADKRLEIRVDRVSLEFYGIGVTTLLGVLQADNLTVPAGTMKQTDVERTVRVVGEFSSVDEVRALRVPLPLGGSVALGDIASVQLVYPEDAHTVRMDGERSLGIFVIKSSDANVVETAGRVKAALAEAAKSLPPGTEVALASDATTFINSSLADTERDLAESIVVTALVLFLFLRRWRSALIVLVAIPTSLVSTFFMMYLFRFSLNILSLMALAMSIGILVDDSIVILENIHRHVQLGKDPRLAAVEGRREIGLAAVAITLCDVVVFAPVAFMRDIVGQFFKEFGLTVVFTTLFSLLVSFTLTPLMASRMLGREKGARRGAARSAVDAKTDLRAPGRFGRFFEKVKAAYRRFLQWALRNRWKVVLVTLALCAGAVALFPLGLIPTEFMPSFDQSRLTVDIDLGPGADVAQTAVIAQKVEAHIMALPEVKDVFSQIGTDLGSSLASLVVNLRDKGERGKSQAAVARELRVWGKALSGINFSVTEPGIIARTSIEGTKAFILNITGPDRTVLSRLGERAEAIVRKMPGTTDVDNSLRSHRMEISVHTDRLALSENALTVNDVALTMRTALSGTRAGVFRSAGDEYDMLVIYDEEDVRTSTDLSAIRVPSPLGRMVPLGLVASFQKADAPSDLQRDKRQNVVTIQANLQGVPLGTVSAGVGRALDAEAFPAGYGYTLGGDVSNMSTAFDSLSLALIASVVLVYLILVVLYQSYLTPLIRMLSLPAGLVGGLAALALTGNTINLVSFIGIIMLDGLISKNGTLLIDYTHTLMKRGLPLREALVEAGVTRLRPIIMTSVTMIVGMLPLALSVGSSSEIKSGMAIVLIGGLITSTLITPILLPVVYTMIEDLRGGRARRRLGGVQ
jgi:HAE1 family hydrophobic/amphiphilic exporter-1